MARRRSSPLGLELVMSVVLALVLLPLLSHGAPLQDVHADLQRYSEGCYYNYNHYSEGDRILTNEPCLNCTCHNKMLMCYLRVCPFTKPIGHDCSVEKREDQCCPIITCPEVRVDVSHHLQLTTNAPGTELSIPEKYGCNIDSKFYPEGAQLPSNPNKPCELCYCIRNRTSCLMQECTLHIDGCQPIYNKGSCCPVRYNCDHENELLELEDHSTTTTTVRPTPGYVLSSTASPIVSTDCIHNNEVYADGASITGKNACEHCYCMRGDIVCAVQECEMPTLESGAKTCRALPPAEGECCPSNYICDDDSAATEAALIDEPQITTVAPKNDLHESVSQEDVKLQEHIDDKVPITESPEKSTKHPESEQGSGDGLITGVSQETTLAPSAEETQPGDAQQTTIAPVAANENKEDKIKQGEDVVVTTVTPVKGTEKTEEIAEDSHIATEQEIPISTKDNDVDVTTAGSVIEEATEKLEGPKEEKEPEFDIIVSTTSSIIKDKTEKEEVISSEESVTSSYGDSAAEKDSSTTPLAIIESEESSTEDKIVEDVVKPLDSDGTTVKSIEELLYTTESLAPPKSHVKSEEEVTGITESSTQSQTDRPTEQDKINQEAPQTGTTDASMQTSTDQDKVDQDLVERTTVSSVYEMITEGEDSHISMPDIHDHKTEIADNEIKSEGEQDVVGTTTTPLVSEPEDKKDHRPSMPVESTTVIGDLASATSSASLFKPLTEAVPAVGGSAEDSISGPVESEEISIKSEEETDTSRPPKKDLQSEESDEAIIKEEQNSSEDQAEIEAIVQEIPAPLSIPAQDTKIEVVTESQEEEVSAEKEEDSETDRIETISASTVSPPKYFPEIEPQIIEKDSEEDSKTEKTDTIAASTVSPSDEPSDIQPQLIEKDSEEDSKTEPIDTIAAFTVSPPKDSLNINPQVTEKGPIESTTISPSEDILQKVVTEQQSEEISDYSTTVPSSEPSISKVEEPKSEQGPTDVTTIIPLSATESQTEQAEIKDKVEKQPDHKIIDIITGIPSVGDLSGPSSVETDKDKQEISEIDVQRTTIIPETSSDEESSEVVEAVEQSSQEIIPAAIPGEGDCLISDRTYSNNATVPITNECEISCNCLNSVVVCQHVQCDEPPQPNNCILDEASTDKCCPQYICGIDSFAKDQRPTTTEPIEDEEIQFTTLSPPKVHQEFSTESPIKEEEPAEPTFAAVGDTQKAEEGPTEHGMIVPTKQPSEDATAIKTDEPAEISTETSAAAESTDKMKPTESDESSTISDEVSLTPSSVDVEVPAAATEKPMSHVKDEESEEDFAEGSSEGSGEENNSKPEKTSIAEENTTMKTAAEVKNQDDSVTTESAKPAVAEEISTEFPPINVGAPKIDEGILGLDDTADADSNTLQPAEVTTEAPSLTSVLDSGDIDFNENETPEQGSNESGEEVEESEEHEKPIISTETTTVKFITSEIGGTTIIPDVVYPTKGAPQEMSHTKIEQELPSETEVIKPAQHEESDKTNESEETEEVTPEEIPPAKAPVSTVLILVEPSKKDPQPAEEKLPSVESSGKEGNPLPSATKPASSEDEPLSGTISEGSGDESSVKHETTKDDKPGLVVPTITDQTEKPKLESQPSVHSVEADSATDISAQAAEEADEMKKDEDITPVPEKTSTVLATSSDKPKIESDNQPPSIDATLTQSVDKDVDKEKEAGHTTITPEVTEQPIAGSIESNEEFKEESDENRGHTAAPAEDMDEHQIPATYSPNVQETDISESPDDATTKLEDKKPYDLTTTSSIIKDEENIKVTESPIAISEKPTDENSIAAETPVKTKPVDESLITHPSSTPAGEAAGYDITESPEVSSTMDSSKYPVSFVPVKPFDEEHESAAEVQLDTEVPSLTTQAPTRDEEESFGESNVEKGSAPAVTTVVPSDVEASTPSGVNDLLPTKADRGSQEEPELSEVPMQEHGDKTLLQTESPESPSVEEAATTSLDEEISTESPIILPIDKILPHTVSDGQIVVDTISPETVKPLTQEIPSENESPVGEKHKENDEKKPPSDKTKKPVSVEKEVTDVLMQTEKPVSISAISDTEDVISSQEIKTSTAPEEVGAPVEGQTSVSSEEKEDMLATTAKLEEAIDAIQTQQVTSSEESPSSGGKPVTASSSESGKEEDVDVTTVTSMDLKETSVPHVEASVVPIEPESTTSSSIEVEEDSEEVLKDHIETQTVAAFVTDRGEEPTSRPGHDELVSDNQISHGTTEVEKKPSPDDSLEDNKKPEEDDKKKPSSAEVDKPETDAEKKPSSEESLEDVKKAEEHDMKEPSSAEDKPEADVEKKPSSEESLERDTKPEEHAGKKPLSEENEEPEDNSKPSSEGDTKPEAGAEITLSSEESLEEAMKPQDDSEKSPSSEKDKKPEEDAETTQSSEESFEKEKKPEDNAEKKLSSEESVKETKKPELLGETETDNELSQTEKPELDDRIDVSDKDSEIQVVASATEQTAAQTEAPDTASSVHKDDEENSITVKPEIAIPMIETQTEQTNVSEEPESSEDGNSETSTDSNEEEIGVVTMSVPVDLKETDVQSATSVAEPTSPEEGASKDDVKVQTVVEFVTDHIDEPTTVVPIQDVKKGVLPAVPSPTSSEEESSTSASEEGGESEEEVSATTEKPKPIPNEDKLEKIIPSVAVTDAAQKPAIEETMTEGVATSAKPTLADEKFITDLPKPIATEEEEESSEEETPLITTLHPLFSHIDLDRTTSQSQVNISDKTLTEGITSETTAHPAYTSPSTTASTTQQSTTVTSAPTTQYQPPSYGHVPPQYPAYSEDEYDEDETEVFGPGTCRYGGKLFVSAQQIPRDDPCDFCFCFRSDIICLQQSCPPPISGCHEEPISGFCCPRYECPVSMATVLNITTSTTTTSTTLPPHFLHHAYRGAAEKNGCHINGNSYKVGDQIDSASGPCMHCTCGGDGQMKCDPKTCSPEPMLRQMIAVVASRRR